MGLNAVSEFGQRDADLTRVTRNDARTQRQSCIGVLAKAKKQGERAQLRRRPGRHGGLD